MAKKTETPEAEAPEVGTPDMEKGGIPRISTELVDFHFVDDVEGLVKELGPLVKTMQKYTREFERILKDFEYGRWGDSLETPPTIEDDIDANSFLADARTQMDSMLAGLNRIFWGMYKSDFYERFLAFQKAYPEHFQGDDEVDSSVKVQFEDGILYVKTPPVFHNFNHVFFAGGKKIDMAYGGFYAYKVAKIMQNYRDECSTFGKRNINILAVYDPKKQFIPDTHNLDFKLMIDAITNEMFGGDSWNWCSVSMASATSDALESGVYFTVTNGFARAPVFSENLAKLTELFGANQPRN